MVKRLGILETLEYCMDTKPQPPSWNRNNVDKGQLLAFTGAVRPFLDKEIQIRVEGPTFNIYCKDKDLLQQLITELAQWVTKIYEPANDFEYAYLYNSTKAVLCNHLPFKQYCFKVYIKSTTPVFVREQFKSWISHYDGKIRAPHHTQEWFKKGSGWGWIPTIYIKDKPTLSMVGLFLGSNIQKVEEFIPRSSINSTIVQEQTCHL